MLSAILVSALSFQAPVSVASTSRAGAVRMGLAVGDKFPADALKKIGVSGKKSVLFFYVSAGMPCDMGSRCAFLANSPRIVARDVQGADDAPSCSKELKAFDEVLDSFASSGVSVVGVRNAAGAKGSETAVKLVVDEDDAIRTEIGIEKDLFGLLGGRETYVLDASGSVVSVFNSQFDPEAHVKTALAAVEELPKNPLEELLADIKAKVGVGV